MFRQLRLQCVRLLLLICGSIVLSVRWVSVIPIFAQTNCTIATTIDFPVDMNVFTLAQDYGAPSARHQGRFHTGIDLYGGRGFSSGQPVHAAAAGRVTYSYALGWGRDGGVVILEHTFSDGTIAYTQYGHITETESILFPPKLSCVEAGQVIGVVGDVRPAPHVHFEVRVVNSDTPGPGYASGSLYAQGWRNPTQFVINMQTWLSSAHRWHIQYSGDDQSSLQESVIAPFLLNDNSILYIESGALKRATSDGRVLWRVTLPAPIIAIGGFQGRALLTFADGTMQYVNPDGQLEESWRISERFIGPPFVAGQWLIFPTANGELAAIGPDRREILWRLENVPPFVRWHVAGDENGFVIGLITQDNEILTISRDGELLDRALLRDIGSMSTSSDGSLLTYTRGGLWHIDRSGTWTLAMEDAPPASYSGAVLVTNTGDYLLFDGRTLRAYGVDKMLKWETVLPDISGLTDLSQVGTTYLLTSTHGHIVAVGEAGRICASLKIFGDDRSQQWHQLGSDGILRVAITNQILGIDWVRFTSGCS